VTLDSEALTNWAESHHKVAGIEALALDPDLSAELDRFVDLVNSKRSRVEHVRKYRILPHDFTIAAGEMTPTLKVKRNIVNTTYRDLIDEMYADD
jgi:long-chain acyl-CoA synthetase